MERLDYYYFYSYKEGNKTAFRLEGAKGCYIRYADEIVIELTDKTFDEIEIIKEDKKKILFERAELKLNNFFT